MTNEEFKGLVQRVIENSFDHSIYKENLQTYARLIKV
jgi:hypothetical protein